VSSKGSKSSLGSFAARSLAKVASFGRSSSSIKAKPTPVIVD